MMKKVFSLFLALNLIATVGYLWYEPQLVKAASATDTVTVSLEVTAEIAITSPSDVALSSIAGITGGDSAQATTSPTTWTVTTNSSTGYELRLSKNHKLEKINSATSTIDDYTDFEDYATSTSPTDYNWVHPSAGAERFGFRVNAGYDTYSFFKYTGTTCGGAGSSIGSSHCWAPVPPASSTDAYASPQDDYVIIASRATSTPGMGTDVIFRAEAGSSNLLETGSYNTTITATANTT